MPSKTIIDQIVFDNFAEDLELPSDVTDWSVEEFTAFVESGGVNLPPAKPVDLVMAPAAEPALVQPAEEEDRPISSPSKKAKVEAESSPQEKSIGGFFSKLFGMTPKK